MNMMIFIVNKCSLQKLVSIFFISPITFLSKSKFLASLYPGTNLVFIASITKICIEYEYDDFYSEIAHFNDLIESNKAESEIMSLDNSVNCAKILDAIREKM